MNDFTRALATLAGGMIVFALMWVLVGFAARAITTLFCFGYGC